MKVILFRCRRHRFWRISHFVLFFYNKWKKKKYNHSNLPISRREKMPPSLQYFSPGIRTSMHAQFRYRANTTIKTPTEHELGAMINGVVHLIGTASAHYLRVCRLLTGTSIRCRLVWFVSVRISSACEATERTYAIHEWTNGNGRNSRRPKVHNLEINSFRRCRMMDWAVSHWDRLQLCIISTVCINHFSADFSGLNVRQNETLAATEKRRQCRFDRYVLWTLYVRRLCIFSNQFKWTDVLLQFCSFAMPKSLDLIGFPFDGTT